MDNKDVLFVNIMGVGKNGTTLLGSLLDNHNELSSFPMEMKFGATTRVLQPFLPVLSQKTKWFSFHPTD